MRSLAQVPPSRQWRTIERHGPGELVGWLSLLHGRPIEHLRAAEASELLFLPAADFHRHFENQPELKQWCAQQTPAIEAVHLLQQLAHANQGRSQQLEQWQQLLPQMHWLVDQSPGLADLDSPGHWYRPDASLWTKTSADQQLQQRLIWLPDPELEASRAAFQAEFDNLVRPVGGTESSKQGQPLQLNRASGPRDIPMAICQAVADVHGVPVYKDSLRDQIDGLLERQPSLNLYNIGQLLTGLDLSVAH